MTTCNICKATPSLRNESYHVKSPVAVEVVQKFVSAIQGEEDLLTAESVDELLQLCEEFDFKALHARVSNFRAKTHSDCFHRYPRAKFITGLESRFISLAMELAGLQGDLFPITSRSEELSALRSTFEGI
jgi:hypothetical protein